MHSVVGLPETSHGSTLPLPEHPQHTIPSTDVSSALDR